MVDVRGGHAQRLRPGAPVLPGQVVVAHAHVDGVAGPDDAADMCDDTLKRVRRANGPRRPNLT